MNPIKNKKDLESSIDTIRNFAYSYLEKYSPSKQQLKTYLYKKIIKKKRPPFIEIIQRNDLPNDYGELSETNL